uniref:Uncharacterized protein n=1 Tax=Anopheles atroparvus TaxID=41427 RepID=A0AAG5D5A4_ANOAO
MNVLIQGNRFRNIHTSSLLHDNRIKFICRGQASPPPFIEFRFVPAAMNDAGSVKSILLQSINVSIHSANVSSTAEMKQPISGPGTVQQLRGHSTCGCPPLFLEHLIDETTVTSSRSSSIPRDEMQFIVTSPIGAINAGSTALLQCKASFYQFSNCFVFQ